MTMLVPVLFFVLVSTHAQQNAGRENVLRYSLAAPIASFHQTMHLMSKKATNAQAVPLLLLAYCSLPTAT